LDLRESHKPVTVQQHRFSEAVQNPVPRTSQYNREALASKFCNGWIYVFTLFACNFAISGASLEQQRFSEASGDFFWGGGIIVN